MQNVYDLAHETARSLKETDQYKDYKDAEAKLKSNEDMSRMMDDFQAKSMEYQTKIMSGQMPEQEELAQMQQMSAIIMSDPLCASYVNAQMQLQTIIGDIFKIIGEAVE